jgi:RNA polymerase sigma-54 factor
MHLGQKMTQSQILAPRMIQSMEILQLTTLDLNARIEQEMQENPVLEEREVEPGEEGERIELEQESDPGAAELVIDGEHSNADDFDRLDALSKDWEDSFNEEHRPSRSGAEEEGDRKYDAMQNMASRPKPLQDHLTDQLSYLDLAPDLERLMRHIIAHIAENGYLGWVEQKEKKPKKKEAEPEEEPVEEETKKKHRDEKSYDYVLHAYSVEDVAKTFPEPVPLERWEEALQMVQKLDPPGIGARDLRECLLLQITPETPYRDLVRVLIQNHLEDIEHNRLPVIERRTGFSIPEIKEALEVIKRFNPRPGGQFEAEQTRYVTPDVAVARNDDGGYDIRLLDDWLPPLAFNRKYIEMYRTKGGDPKTREWLKQKIQAAQWLQDSIQQRRNTLEKVTRAIIDHQKAFLDKGPEHIEPLKMQQIAEQVGVHVTTVSRAVDDKYVETPRGVFPLKRFFGGGARTDSGEEVAYEVIKRRLLEIIDQEDKSNPLSDEDLEKRLNEAGYPVKRRTVTKYRKMLDIPSSRQRKDWTVVAPTATAAEAVPTPAPIAAPAPVTESNGEAAPV